MITRPFPTEFVSAELLASILAAAPSLPQLVTQSYRHPNGFVKIPLARATNGSSIRLHYWPESTSADGNIHSHRWDMTSHILLGRYRAVDFEEADSGLPAQKFACSENAHGLYQITAVGSTTLRKTAEREYGSGSAYEMPAGNIHRVISVVAPPVLSLVFCSMPRSLESFIYSHEGGIPTNPPAEKVPAGLIEELLNWVERFDAAPPLRSL